MKKSLVKQSLIFQVMLLYVRTSILTRGNKKNEYYLN
jgi:hypothetical protein